MISGAMAVAAAGNVRVERAEKARQARPMRLMALVFDLFLFALLSFVINLVFGTTQVTSGTVPTGDSGSFAYTTATAVAWPWQLLLAAVYYVVPEALFGATPGKSLTGLCVVRVDGGPLTVRDIVIRNVLRVVDWLPFLYIAGGTLALFSVNSQRLGDVAAGTTVVSRAHATGPGATRNVGRQGRRLAAIVLVGAAIGTIAFDYFGRPPLIIDAMYNERQMPIRNSGYTLGSPIWSWGHVRYPISGLQGGSPTSECIGSIRFDWLWFTWNQAGADFRCGLADTFENVWFGKF